MIDPTARLPRCTIVRSRGEFCDSESLEDVPFPICARHALQLYRHLADLTGEEVAALGPQRVSEPPTTYTGRRDRNAALRTLTAGESAVYAVQFPDGVIKIGHSANLAHRLNAYSAADGVLVGFMLAGYDTEQEIHRTLREHRARGREWYHPTPPVLAVVNEMRQTHGLEPLTPEAA